MLHDVSKGFTLDEFWFGSMNWRSISSYSTCFGLGIQFVHSICKIVQ